MASDRSVLERQLERVELRPFTLDGFHRRRQRKDRNRRIGSAVVALVVVGATVGGLLRAFSTGPGPVGDARRSFLGTWVSTDIDGSIQHMRVRSSGDEGVEIVVHDDSAGVCSGVPSTMTGTGGVVGTDLVIPAPVLTCDDGSEPALNGAPLREQLRDWTLFLDSQTDTLSDGVGGVWLREGAEDPLADLEPLWPQTSLEEVRQAQELADAGDPRYTWQVDPELGVQVGQHHPGGDAEIFARFLEEELGWEKFRWEEAAAHPDGLNPGDVVYIRCAPGLTNPLYPTDPERAGCAPTIDEFQYETVKINVAQLDLQGPSGIWVVTGREEIEPFEQFAPPSDAEITALLEPFLQARIDGKGAERFADFAEYDPFASERVDREIPLLYATSTGAPYERSEFEVVDGPVWPEGSMQLKVRLFADNGGTMVEQLFSLERDETGRLRLVYDFEPEGPEGPVLATTENGGAVPVEYGFLDGEVTYRAAYPAQPDQEDWVGGPDRAVIAGLPFHQRNLSLLWLLADPRPIGPGCKEAPAPADAEALARSIRSDTDLEATAPEAVTIGGIPALQMDVLLAPGAIECPWQLTYISATSPVLLKQTPIGEDQLVRLYLLDLPGGSARVLAIVIIHADVEHALEMAAPIVDSIEFHTG